MQGISLDQAARISLAGRAGMLLQADPRLPVQWEPGIFEAPQGLYLSVLAGPGAVLEITARAMGGGIATRRLSIGPAGAWLSVTGWSQIQVEILTVGSVDVRCAASLTRQAPPGNLRLILVETLDSSGALVPVPAGARRIAVSAVPGGMTWQTSQGGPVLVIPAALVAGTFADVAGTGFVNVVPGIVACWEMEAL